MADLPSLYAAAAQEERTAAQGPPADRVAAMVRAARLRIQSGHTARAAKLLEAARAHAQGLDDPMLAAHVTAALGRLYAVQARPGTAADLLAQAVATWRDAGASAPLVQALVDLADVWFGQGRTDAALALLTEATQLASTPAQQRAITLTRALEQVRQGDVRVVSTLQRLARDAKEDGDTLLEGQALTALGRALVDQRDYLRGRAAHQAALPLHAATGHRAGAAASLGGLGLCRLGADAPADAVQLLTQAVKRCAETHDLAAEAAWRTYLDDALVRLDRSEWRARELERFIEVTRQLGDEAWTASLCSALGSTWHDVRDGRAAQTWHTRALAISEARQDTSAMAVDHANLGLAALLLGDPGQAAQALATARALDAEAPVVATLEAALSRQSA